MDSCLFWAREYHVDGFRFDLMALIDTETMNAVRAALDALPGGDSILMYGEPWMGGATCMAPGTRPSDKGALDVLDARIGFFCDETRDAIKGSVFDAGSRGYVNGGPYYGVRLLHAVDAWRDGADGFRPRASGQVVQYALPPTTTTPCGTSSSWRRGAAALTIWTPTCWPRTGWPRASI